MSNNDNKLSISGHRFYSPEVERLFFIGTDISKPGRCRLSDNHFEMLSFLKGNLNCYHCIRVYRIKIALLFGFNIKINDCGLNTHHGALHVKNKVFFAACTKVTVTKYFFKFVTELL